VEDLLQVCPEHTLTPAVAAEFLSKSNSSRPQLNAPSRIHVKRVKKTVLVQNITPYDDRHAFDIVMIRLKTARGTSLWYCAALIISLSHMGEIVEVCVMPSLRFIGSGKRKNMIWSKESADSTCTFLLRYCEAYAANDVAMSANPRFSVFLIRLSLTYSLLVTLPRA